jgi:hypothetical protein
MSSYVPVVNVEAGTTTSIFAPWEVIVGQTSLCTAQVLVSSNTGDNVAYMITSSLKSDANLENTHAGFIAGEQIVGHSGVTATIDSFVQGDYDNGYFDLPPEVIAVTKIFAPYDSRMSADILFDPQSQFNMSLLSNFTSSSIIPYFIGRTYQQLINDTFRGRPGIRFQRHQNRVYVDVNMYNTFRPGYYVMVDCVRVLDPETYPLVWSDRWLQRYTIALFKRQWGMNLSKYNGIALPGSVTLDGRTMLTEANQEVKDLELELQNTYQLPVDFIVG